MVIHDTIKKICTTKCFNCYFNINTIEFLLYTKNSLTLSEPFSLLLSFPFKKNKWLNSDTRPQQSERVMVY
jgi:hypothetical protein